MTDGEGLTNPTDYQVDAFVDQLDRNGSTLKSYTLRGIPKHSYCSCYDTNDRLKLLM